MPASFPVGLSKVEAGTAPRLIVVSGDEPELIKKVTNAFRTGADSNFYTLDKLDSGSIQMAFTQGHRVGRETRIAYGSVLPGLSFDWLPQWFNQVKGTKILVTTDAYTGNKLERIANTRGIHIVASSPTGDAQQSKYVKLLAKWYNESPTQINLLLNKYDWNISSCLQLLDKLRLLNLSLTSDTMLKLGVVQPSAIEFVNALCVDNPAQAMTVISRINTCDYASILRYLSQWLDKLARVKSGQAFMKKPAELAFEVGVPTKETEKFMRIGRRFEYARINRIALALAAADSDVSQGRTNGVLEILVSKW